MTDFDQKTEPPAEPETLICPMCHHETLRALAVSMAGRLLCAGCARTWYEDEDGNEEAS